jgi:hypothetical protein
MSESGANSSAQIKKLYYIQTQLGLSKIDTTQEYFLYYDMTAIETITVLMIETKRLKSIHTTTLQYCKPTNSLQTQK